MEVFARTYVELLFHIRVRSSFSVPHCELVSRHECLYAGPVSKMRLWNLAVTGCNKIKHTWHHKRQGFNGCDSQHVCFCAMALRPEHLDAFSSFS